MTEFAYSDLLPLGPDDTQYRLVTDEGVETFEAGGQRFLRVEPEALTRLTDEAMHDIAHYLRPAHLAQLRRILDDPEASANDRFVALDLLKNANIAAGGVLPDVPGHRHRDRHGQAGRAGRSPAATTRRRSAAASTTPTPRLNLRYSQLAPLTMWDERNTGSNLPAQIEIYATPPARARTSSCSWPRAAAAPTSRSCTRRPRRVLNPDAMLRFLDEKLRSLGTAACPPYHLAIVVGGTQRRVRAEDGEVRVGAATSTRCRRAGSRAGHGFRDLELEAEVLELTRRFGIGAQFGGKYFCHDVRVVRLPRHGASCPVAIAVSCSADRQALGKITAEGVFLEQLETDPAQYLPDTTDEHLDDEATWCGSTSTGRWPRSGPSCRRYPVKTRLSLTGPLVVARDIAHAKIKERLDAGEPMPAYLRDHAVYYAGPGQDARGLRLRLVRADHGRADGLLRRAVPGRRRLARHAGQGQPVSAQVTDGLRGARRLLPRLDRRPGGPAGPGLHQAGRGAGVPRARHGGGLEDRGRGLPGVRRRRRQGQRLLRRDVPAGGDDDRPPPWCLTGAGGDRAGARRACRRHRSGPGPVPDLGQRRRARPRRARGLVRRGPDQRRRRLGPVGAQAPHTRIDRVGGRAEVAPAGPVNTGYPPLEGPLRLTGGLCVQTPNPAR